MLAACATACADVSDGLAADLGHVTVASGVGASLELEALPLSEPARGWVAAQPDRAEALVRLATGGDDYELVFTASEPPPPGPVPVTRVGEVVSGSGVLVRYEGAAVLLPSPGWRHP